MVRSNLINALVLVAWVVLCSGCGLWSLHSLAGSYCVYTLKGHGHTNFSFKKNPAAYLEYGRRMRTGFAFQVRAMCGQNAELINKFRTGGYEGQREVFDNETTAFANALLESVELFDGQQVPDVMEKSHAKIANCHRLCYESVQALREAYGAEGADQERLIREADKKMKEAWTTGDAGVKLHNAIGARTASFHRFSEL